MGVNLFKEKMTGTFANSKSIYDVTGDRSHCYFTITDSVFTPSQFSKQTNHPEITFDETMIMQGLNEVILHSDKVCQSGDVDGGLS